MWTALLISMTPTFAGELVVTAPDLDGGMHLVLVSADKAPEKLPDGASRVAAKVTLDGEPVFANTVAVGVGSAEVADVVDALGLTAFDDTITMGIPKGIASFDDTITMGIPDDITAFDDTITMGVPKGVAAFDDTITMGIPDDYTAFDDTITMGVPKTLDGLSGGAAMRLWLDDDGNPLGGQLDPALPGLTPDALAEGAPAKATVVVAVGRGVFSLE